MNKFNKFQYIIFSIAILYFIPWKIMKMYIPERQKPDDNFQSFFDLTLKSIKKSDIAGEIIVPILFIFFMISFLLIFIFYFNQMNMKKRVFSSLITISSMGIFIFFYTSVSGKNDYNNVFITISSILHLGFVYLNLRKDYFSS